jgi:hypothetical protein
MEMSEQKNRVFSSLLGYLFPVAVLILIVFALWSGFYLFHVESSPSLYTYLGGIVLVVAGFLMKFLFDLLMVNRKKKREKIELLRELLIECEENLELVESKKIRWPQVHFNVTSYTAAREKTALNYLTSALHEQIVEAYQLISEIEKRKFRAFDKTTDTMLEKLASMLPEVVKELKLMKV